jgi:hypothetical protein
LPRKGLYEAYVHLVLKISDSDLAFIIAHGHFNGFGKYIRVAVGDALESVLLFIQLYNEDRRVDFFQRTGPFDALRRILAPTWASKLRLISNSAFFAIVHYHLFPCPL